MLRNIHIIIAGLLTVIAAFYQIECDTERWKAVEVANILVPPEHLARFLANADVTSKWFHWLSHFKEADTRPLGVGKKYQAFYNIPLIGEIVMLFRLTDYEPNHLFVLESESFLKPRFTMLLKKTEDGKTLLTLRL
ncbi:hypothetical protein Avbf_01529 [Armadillidium vulgare]|nr:hypothetical protein Avbf_01529 [Armadillidium vulgare]